MALNTTHNTEIAEIDTPCASENLQEQSSEAQEFTYTTKKSKVCGRGYGITGMVFGIISSFYALYLLLVTVTFIDFFKFIPYLTQLKSFVEAISFGMSPTLIAGLIFIFTAIAFLGIAYSKAGKIKGYKNRIGSVGMVLGILSIVLYIPPFIFFFDIAFNF